MSNIKAIIFDYGGVIGNNPSCSVYKTVSKKFNIDKDKIKGEFLNFIFDLEKGQIIESVFWKKMARNLNIANHSNLREVWLKEFIKKAKINNKVVSLIKELEGHYKLCLLSNNAIFFQTPKSSRILKKHFDILIYSFNVKMRKPEKEIYEYALARLRLKPHECIIIDDDEKKLFYPKKIGMVTIHFKSFTEFKKTLKKKIENNK